MDTITLNLGAFVVDALGFVSPVSTKGGWAKIPPKTNRKTPIFFSPWVNKQRNLVERFSNNLKYYRRIAIRYGKLGSVNLAMLKLACISLSLRHFESTAWCSVPKIYKATSV